MGPGGSTDISFGVLGSIEVRADGDPLTVGSARERTLLALLLVHVNQVVSVDRIIDGLWGESPPASAVHTVHGLVSRVRGVIGSRRLVTEPPGYALRVDASEVDALVFERTATLARELAEAGEPAKAVAAWDDALALWRGPAYVEFADRAWAQPEAARLTELRAAAVEGRAEWMLHLGHAPRVVADLDGVLDEEPLREGMQALRMVALARAGRPVEALRAYERLRSLLAEELGVTPSTALRRLHHDILRQHPDLDWDLSAAVASPTAEATLPTPAGAATPGLPVVLTELVGRRAELAALAEHLQTRRLVSVVGPGGVGKTRLAIEACRSILETDGRALAWVDLTVAHDGETIASTVATALRAPLSASRPIWESVLAYLSARPVLLVLDNCEHVVTQVAALLTDLFGAAPGVAVLATSRQPLHLPGEQAFPLRPLDIPTTEPPSAIADVDSVVLFVERARDVRPDFTLTPASARPVAEICRRLDGIPLALELAAARMGVLGVVELAQRLDDRFAVLAPGPHGSPGRHRTLATAVEWSFDLLEDDERTAFCQLAAFPAGFDLAAVEAVLGPATDALGALSALVGKSLVTVDPQPDGTVRYRLLETMREFGRLRLGQRGDEDAVRARHGEHYARLVAEAATRMLGPEEPDWSDRVVMEMPNLRAALHWACATERLDLAVGLLAPLHPSSPLPTAVVRELGSWASTIAAMPAAAAHPAFADVCAWGLAGADVAGDRDDARRWLERAGGPGVARTPRLLSQTAQALLDFERQLVLRQEAVDLATEHGDDFTVGFELATMTLISGMLDPGPDVRALGHRAIAVARRTGCPSLIVRALMCLGLILAERDPEEAVRLAEQASSYRDVMRDPNTALRNFDGLRGRSLILQRDRSGLATYRDTFEEAVAAGDHMVARNAIFGVFEACAVLGDDERAAELAGGLRAACGDLGVMFGSFIGRDDQVRARMGTERYEAVRARAASWDWAELVRRTRAILEDSAEARGTP
jgi:predicted ATPase/DNA-binding SARP family transcriptional activator